jgi:ParB family chromosome partitioning protein
MSITAANPLRCRVWNLHSRLDENLTEESCRAEIESFEKHGQLVPALGRRVRGDPDYDIELIYGARRLFIARYLNRPLLVELRDISDRDGIIAMELENRLRQDISAYERGLSYERWLRTGHFSSQHEIANALQMSPAQISRLLKLARLPATVVEAFSNATDICEVWGAQLAALMKDVDSERRIAQAARNVAAIAPRPPADEIYKLLCSAARARQPGTADNIVKDQHGEELFRVKHQRGSVVFTISLDILSQESLETIEHALACVIDPAKDEERKLDTDAQEEIDLTFDPDDLEELNDETHDLLV